MTGCTAGCTTGTGGFITICGIGCIAGGGAGGCIAGGGAGGCIAGGGAGGCIAGGGAGGCTPYTTAPVTIVR
jgi:hypothetical protein